MRLGLHFSCSSVEGEGWPDIYEAALDQAELADQLGYDAAVVSEHHFKKEGWIPSPFVLCGAIAARTKRLRVGTDITILPFQHPIRVAEDVLTLDNLTRGRAVLGVGLGAHEREFVVFQTPFAERARRSEESMTIIRRLLAEESVTHEGRYFRFENVTVTPRPVQHPGPPLWYGAISAAGARRAARYADALIVGPGPSHEEVRAIRAAYDEELRKLGKDPAEHRIILRREGYVAEDAATAWAEALEPLHYQYTHIYRDFPPSGTPAEFRRFAAERFLVGDPGQVLAQSRELCEEVGAELLLFRFQLPGLPDDRVYESTRLLGEEMGARL